MNIFDVVLIQPIFNILLCIYALIPGHDFGIALILFTVLVRFILWPLIRKQLHQARKMQALQPELRKIKEKTKGNRQLESQLMMELYRERDVNPFGSIGLLLVQLPVFIALYSVVRLITDSKVNNIAKYAYGFLRQLPYVQDVIANPHHLDHMLFGVVDLTKTALGHGIYWPLLIMALAAAGFQFWQSKQLLPKPKEGQKLRDMFKAQAAGVQVDQGEMSALMTSRMSYFFPVLMFIFSIYFVGAVVVYLLTTSIVAVIQQGMVLGKDSQELEQLVSSKTNNNPKLKNAQEAEIVSEPLSLPKKQRRKRA